MNKAWEKSRNDRAMMHGAMLMNLSRKIEVEHQGETVEQFLARGGKIKRADTAMVDGYLNIYPALRAAAPFIKGPRRPRKTAK